MAAPSAAMHDDEGVHIAASPLGDIYYAPGRGVQVADRRLVIGGYSSVVATANEGQTPRLLWDELSFLVNARVAPTFQLFTELEFEEIAGIDGNGAATTKGEFQVERLYGEWGPSDTVNFRVGKFLTPVGRWNEIHAPPLVWTTSRPLVTMLPFDQHTTGAMLFGGLPSGSGVVRYSVYGQGTDSFEPVAQRVAAERSVGTRVEYEGWDAASVGAGYLSLRHGGEWHHLLGLDLSIQREAFEVMAEGLVDLREGHENEWGAYLQTAVPTIGPLFAVGRYEYFRAATGEQEVHLFDIGVAYRLRSYCLLKAEYLIAARRSALAEPGFKASLAVLF